MCLACALPALAGDWTSAGVAPASVSARPGADPVLGCLTTLLAREGLTLRRLGAGTGFLVSASSGRALRAPTIEALWPAVRALTGRPLDPLAPRFLGPANDG